MENINIGIISLMVSDKLKESYFNKKLISESKKQVSDFIDVIKTSPILQLEFKVFSNIENKFIEGELSASRYIDNNIKLFEVYTIQEINEEHDKLKHFINENIEIDHSKVKLYESISNLINEHICDYNHIDVNKLHESFTYVLEHIRKPKESLINIKYDDLINEEVLKIATNKFNQKYNSLSETDKELFNMLSGSSNTKKEKLLEEYKNETIQLLESSNIGNVNDTVEKAVNKINEMLFSVETIDDNIISLFELKKDLL